MNTDSAVVEKSNSAGSGRLSRFYEKMFVRRLQPLTGGFVEIKTPSVVHYLGDRDADLRVVLQVKDGRFFERAAQGGSVGAAESYMAGEWQCSELTELVRILMRNRHLLDQMEGGVAAVAGWLLKRMHRLNRNTRDGSKRNIAAHYDIGNELFELFLDNQWMMYSSALYQTGSESLEDAQTLKLARLCNKLDLASDDHLLEIGTGWGGCAIYAASRYGCKVTTTTISKEQHKLAGERVRQAGLQDRVTVLLKDYRDLKGEYDKLISIEMVEAVGHQYLDEYFSRCAQLLKPDGLAVIQAITIEDSRYKRALRSVDFIKRYIFPGSFIPCVSVLTQSAARADLRLTSLEDIGPSYAQTLNHWRQRFMGQLDKVRQLGYPESFIRMWKFYFCYCEGGFMERSISDVQLLFARDQNRRRQWVPGND